ncbi:METTL5 family protein [Ferroplasma acidiphilum]|uniref:METTL5 family protein n=1 Tax=Ferroplasma acidiphilum TaxID=74969 RepID=UPI0023F1C85E|nr:METTL5 family protein [Ferroplasma acidiphilum]WMT53041.1 MAG: METTL5 family protein [Ferroplasma acidiphilum]
METRRNKINKKALEIFLSRLEKPDFYNINLEQYPTDADTASTLLIEAYMDGNIAGKDVIDLGTGNGIFAIGASYLGAKVSTGIDIDPEMVATSRKNAENTASDAEFANVDVSDVKGEYDTVLMNPPFGSVIKHDDMPFINKAIEIGTHIYSIHNIKSYEYIREFYSQRIQIIRQERIFIKVPRLYAHHTDNYHEIESVLVYGIKN